MAGADIDMLSETLIEGYLSRLGLAFRPAPTRDTLDLLVARHLAVVPFENIDVFQRRPIELDTRTLVEKLVLRRRGGFCFEVNEAFRALLDALGYRVDRVEGQVWLEPVQRFGVAFDHLAMIVHLEDERLLVDVAFGDNNRRPISLPGGAVSDVSGRYRLTRADDGQLLLMRTIAEGERPLYRFNTAPRQLHEFQAMCAYHQTSPDSIFTKGLICTLATPTGRITVTRNRLIVAVDGTRTERPVSHDVELAALLHCHFAITL